MDGLHSHVDSALEIHRIGTGSDILQTFCYDRLCQDRGCCGAVTRDITRLRSYFANHRCTEVLDRIFEFDLLSHRNTVLGDRWGAELLVDHHIATLWSECDLHCVCELIHAALKRCTGINIERYDLACHSCSVLIGFRNDY